MLRQKDPATLASFLTWFGKINLRSRNIILEHIRRNLALLRRLTPHHFYEITHLNHRKHASLLVYPDDPERRIALGHAFWRAPSTGPGSKAIKVIEANCLFYPAQKNYATGGKASLALVSFAPDKALINTENFAGFIAN